MFAKNAVRCYYIITILSVLLWIPYPELSYLLHINSTILAFMSGIGSENVLLLLVAFAWMLIFVVLFVAGIVRAEKCEDYFLIIIVSGFDLLISLFFMLHKLYLIYVGGFIFIGFLLHTALYVVVVACVIKERHKRNRID